MQLRTSWGCNQQNLELGKLYRTNDPISSTYKLQGRKTGQEDLQSKGDLKIVSTGGPGGLSQLSN